MAICGLVITINALSDVSSEDDRALIEARQEALLGRLARDPRITLGEPNRGRLPLVLETTDKADYLRCWDELEGLAEVASLELASIHFDEGELEYEVGVAQRAQEPPAQRREAE